MSHLQIRDALDGAPAGSLVRAPETLKLYEPLRLLIGDIATERIIAWAGLVGLRRMSAAELVKTTGIKEDEAERVVALRAFHTALGQYRMPKMRSSQEVVEGLPPGFGNLETEVLLGCALNAQCELIATIVLGRGGSHGLVALPKDIFVPLVRLGATGFVLVHNHPSGAVDPSEDDIRMTNAVARLGRELGIRLFDHLIVAEEDVLSFADLGLMPEEGEAHHGH